MTVQSSTQNDLFNLDLIRTYVDKELNPRFVERDWLKRQVEGKLADPDCRFVLLTAEPGAGKSAFMAWLAHQHPDWCRYFIRRDQRTPLGDVGSYSFLLQVGFQLAVTYPDLFKQEQIKIVVEQRFGTATNSEIVGAEIGKMFASPFYEKVIQIQQQVTHSKDTNITGVRIGEFYATERDLPIDKLQFMALFDPAKAMLKQVQEAVNHPQRQIVVLVDALDELRYQDSELSLLKWLTSCPELPANLRFVLTCRPDDDLLRAFRGSQQGRIQEIAIAEEDPDVEKDLTIYTRFLIETPEVSQTLIEMHQDSDAFTRQAVTKAIGNFGYLGAIGRAVDEAIHQNQQDLLREILKLSELPDTLQGLYAFFLSKIKDAVSKTQIWNPNTDDFFVWETVWEDLYQPILGTLTVTLEPLTASQIQKFSAVSEKYLNNAIERLRQFLDKLDNCYRLYHSTLPEFFTSQKTKERTDYAYCYVDAVRQNQRIVNYYQAGKKIWAEVDLKKIAEDDYGRRHLAQHLVKGDRVDELHTLLNLEKDGKNAWFMVKDDEGDAPSFLADVELAWSQVDEAFNHERGKSIGLQCRYALIKASINSLAKIPVSLMVALVKQGDWEPAKALTQIRQIPYPAKRFESLLALAEPLETGLLKDQVLQLALQAAQDIPDQSSRTWALGELVDKLPPEFLPQEALEAAQTIKNESACDNTLMVETDKPPRDQVSEDVQEIQKEYYCAEVLKTLTDELTSETLIQALEAVQAIQDEFDRAEALTALVAKISKLAPKKLPQLLEVARAIQDKSSCAWVLKTLSDELDPKAVFQALEAAQAIQDEKYRAKALRALANKLTSEIRPQALEAAQAIQHPFYRAQALMALVDKQSDDAWFEVLASAQAIQNEVHRVWVLMALVDQRPNLRSQALEAVQAIQNNFDRTQELRSMAVKLPERLPQALEAAQAIQHEYYRAKAFMALTDELTPETLPQALETAQATESEYYRAPALTALASHLINVNDSDCFSLWKGSMHFLSYRTRPDLLSDMAALAPVIFALSGAKPIQVMEAIQDVARWWP